MNDHFNKLTTIKKTPTLDQNLKENSNIEELREKTGAIQRFMIDRSISKESAKIYKKVEKERLNEEANIAVTAIKLAGTSIVAAMVAKAMPSLGALTTSVNSATAAVDQALSNGNSAEIYTHMKNRNKSGQLFDELSANGEITTEETKIIKDLIDENTAGDISRSKERMEKAKNAVDVLHSMALVGITNAENKWNNK